MSQPTEPPVALVTGGSRGLGAGLVEGFLGAGYCVATCSRSVTEAVEDWSSGEGADRFLHRVVDITDGAATAEFVSTVVDRFGTIDVLVNNAGVAREGVIALASEDEVDEVIDLNLKGTIMVTRQVTRRMLQSGSGRIINISSIIGLAGYRGLSVYGATKAALDGFTRALARELGSRGITVNSVAPGYLRTEMSHGLDDAQMGQIERRTPAGRLGEPEDVVGAVLFLASPAASFISGTTMVIDGGLTA